MHRLLQETKEKIRSENHSGSGQRNSSFFYVFHYRTFENAKFDKNFTNFDRTLFKMVLNCAYASPITGNEEKNPIRKPFGVWPAENTIFLYISLYDILKYQIRQKSVTLSAHSLNKVNVINMHR